MRKLGFLAAICLAASCSGADTAAEPSADETAGAQAAAALDGTVEAVAAGDGVGWFLHRGRDVWSLERQTFEGQAEAIDDGQDRSAISLFANDEVAAVGSVGCSDPRCTEAVGTVRIYSNDGSPRGEAEIWRRTNLFEDSDGTPIVGVAEGLLWATGLDRFVGINLENAEVVEERPLLPGQPCPTENGLTVLSQSNAGEDDFTGDTPQIAGPALPGAAVTLTLSVFEDGGWQQVRGSSLEVDASAAVFASCIKGGITAGALDQPGWLWAAAESKWVSRPPLVPPGALPLGSQDYELFVVSADGEASSVLLDGALLPIEPSPLPDSDVPPALAYIDSSASVRVACAIPDASAEAMACDLQPV